MLHAPLYYYIINVILIQCKVILWFTGDMVIGENIQQYKYIYVCVVNKKKS